MLFALSTHAQWTDNGTNLTTTDKVGIGTVSPLFNLDIKTNNTYEGNNLYFGDRRFYLAGITGTGSQMYGGLILNNLTSIHGGLRSLEFSVGNNNFSSISNPENKILSIQSTGRVGIGSGEMIAKYPLDIKTNSGYEGNNLYFGDRRIYLAGITGTGKQMYGGFVLINEGSGVRSLNIVAGNNDFSTDKNPENVIMKIKSSGKVGIGTDDTGSHRLAVDGSIGAREIKVEASGWSDFVFYEDYELRTLEEVERHIEEQGHLPQIPSENEVIENGINLGEMDAKLLQKIEELTLYLIQQNKQLQAQQEKIDELEKKVNN